MDPRVGGPLVWKVAVPPSYFWSWSCVPVVPRAIASWVVLVVVVVDYYYDACLVFVE